MSCAVILHGPIGSGKTTTCLQLAERVKAEDIHVRGVLSPRVFLEGELVGYDCLDLSSGEAFPLARLRDVTEGPGWLTFGQLIYSFSSTGLERANRVLRLSSRSLGPGTIVFVDEFGRLERSGSGMYPGVIEVSGSLSRGGVAVFACRSNLVGVVEGILKDKVERIFRFEPGEFGALWSFVRGILGA